MPCAGSTPAQVIAVDLRVSYRSSIRIEIRTGVRYYLLLHGSQVFDGKDVVRKAREGPWTASGRDSLELPLRHQ